MKAIITKYLPATNTLPSRIKASAEGVKSEIYTCNKLDDVRYSDGLEHLTNHQVAAKLFAHDNHWSTKLASGGLPSGEWAHCFVVKSIEPQIRETNEIRAQELCHLGQSEAEVFRSSRCASDLGQVVTEKLFPKPYTVITVSSNANSFGYKSVLALAEDGEGLEFLVQSYGTNELPVRGDVVTAGEPRFYGAPRALPRASAEIAKALLKGVKL